MSRPGDLPGGLPDRSAEPRDDLTGWERGPHVCGCGRGCSSWPDHHARIDREDLDDEREARADRNARLA